jgi:tRNA-specific 2-thiouridylase
MKTGKKKEIVFVGLSGGVDSSVSATRLKDQGYDVVGVFIKTWQPDFLVCNWEAERLDAMRVAAHLSIPFLTCDAVESYKKGVAEYMITEYKSGRTPNPDVMCNRYVKFGTFLEFMNAHGGAKIATGHYAQVREHDGTFHLYRGVDTGKDQSYFLWTLTQEQLALIYFPVGDSEKTEVRREAEAHSLPTFTKADSQGVCFLGDINMEEFLSHYIETEEGPILNETGQRIGTHTGALFYTIGQRHGFTINTETALSVPHYVVQKDMEQNTITVSTTPSKVQGNRIRVMQLNLIQGSLPQTCEAQFRYRQTPFTVSCELDEHGHVILEVIDQNVDMPSLGQSCVFYSGTECLGGGIIADILYITH